MIQYKLHIETHGICTHFRQGVVSGVPHRVVLADTTHIQAGTIAIREPEGPGVPVDPQDEGPVFYYLIPHFPHLEIVEGHNLTIPDLLLNGDIIKGSRLQVLNCVEDGIDYVDADATNAPRLTTYYPDYVPSDDVVLNGRASCYFDFYGGSVAYVPPPPDTRRPGSMLITMHTYGPPELLVTPLAQSARAHRVRIEAPNHPEVPIRMKLKNAELKLEIPAEQELGAYDFMLHYLTARGGIPPTLASKTPGMPDKLLSASRERMAGALAELSNAMLAANDAAGMVRPLITEDIFTESCAPSQYP